MKCQNCHEHESEVTLRIDYKTQQWEMSLCPQCAAWVQQHTAAALAEYRQRVAAVRTRSGVLEQGAGAGAGSTEPGAESSAMALHTQVFPADAGEEIRARRRCNELQTRLREAVEAEQYEEAASLRDAIKELRKGVCIYER